MLANDFFQYRRRHQFKFTEPTEIVTMSLLDLGEEGTQLTYTNVGAAVTGRAEALSGVERMLRALENSLSKLREMATARAFEHRSSDKCL